MQHISCFWMRGYAMPSLVLVGKGSPLLRKSGQCHMTSLSQGKSERVGFYSFDQTCWSQTMLLGPGQWYSQDILSCISLLLPGVLKDSAVIKICRFIPRPLLQVQVWICKRHWKAPSNENMGKVHKTHAAVLLSPCLIDTLTNGWDA